MDVRLPLLWRTPSEILTLEWKQVDFSEGTVPLEPGTTKNDAGQILPFQVLPELAELVSCYGRNGDGPWSFSLPPVKRFAESFIGKVPRSKLFEKRGS